MKSHVFFTACRSLLMVAFSALPGWAALHAQDRVALVIGNNDYDEGGNFPDLDNCVHDAALIKDTLEAVHFKVFFLENATRSQMDETLESFESSITKGSTAVFYFAGHGIEFNGKNYLMGTNAKLQARSRLGEEAMDAETFAGAMMLAGAKSSFLFLDCCREVPNDAG
ncbi:MAG TPA: caspase family protein, partial [Verrucomicrobiales bacterium]|nr:caspase family protein [Verrucomicrobiales bacterium]